MNFTKALCLLLPLILIGCTSDLKMTTEHEVVINNEDSKLGSNEIKSNPVLASSPIAPKERGEISKYNDKKYDDFFAYDSSNIGNEPNTEPGTGGKLILRDDCLLLQQNGELKVPVFPSEESRWDNVNKIMVVNGIFLPLGKVFSVTGSEYQNPDFSKFKKVGNPLCVEGRKFESIWTNISF